MEYDIVEDDRNHHDIQQSVQLEIPEETLLKAVVNRSLDTVHRS
jgi:hypothetical protein